MLNRNAIWVGLVLGLVIPFVGYALLLTLFEQLDAADLLSSKGFSPNFRQRPLSIVALCLNILPFNLFYKRRHLHSMRGIAIVTVGYAVAWVVYFGNELLG
mgnify:CR=1 FL=1